MVDEQPVDFSYTLGENARVEVFPVQERLTYHTDKRLQHIGILNFVSDVHLGGLTRNLRLLGFDVAYDQKADDRQLLEFMANENRA